MPSFSLVSICLLACLLARGERVMMMIMMMAMMMVGLSSRDDEMRLLSEYSIEGFHRRCFVDETPVLWERLGWADCCLVGRK